MQIIAKTMGLSSIAVAQREKEDEALRYFVVFSLIGSLALHIAVLILGSFWLKQPGLAEKPIEVIVFDPPSPQAAKPKQMQGGTIARGTLSASQGGRTRGTSVPSSQAKTPSTGIAQPSRPVVAKPSRSPETAAIKKPVATKPPKRVATSKPVPPVPPPKPVAPKPLPIPLTASPPNRSQSRVLERARQPAPVIAPSPRPIATPKPTTSQPPQPVVASPQLENLLGQSDNANRESDRNVAAGLRQERSGSGSGSGTRDSRLATGTGTGNGLENGFGTGSGLGNGDDGSSLGSKRGRIACRRCPEPSYPSTAKSNGWEGTVKVMFDADSDGNVKNVSVASSSGHDLLDEAAIETVKEWKLKSSDNERVGITQTFTFAIKGSNFERQARERGVRQRREAVSPSLARCRNSSRTFCGVDGAAKR